jgi:hypothetical protein
MQKRRKQNNFKFNKKTKCNELMSSSGPVCSLYSQLEKNAAIIIKFQLSRRHLAFRTYVIESKERSSPRSVASELDAFDEER